MNSDEGIDQWLGDHPEIYMEAADREDPSRKVCGFYIDESSGKKVPVIRLMCTETDNDKKLSVSKEVEYKLPEGGVRRVWTRFEYMPYSPPVDCRRFGC